MNGDRRLFTCPACGKRFFYWVPEAVAQPKVKCSFCGADSYPHGEPPAAPPPAPAPAPKPVAAPPAATAPAPAPEPAAAAPPAEGTPAH